MSDDFIKEFVHSLQYNWKLDPRYLKYEGSKAIPFSYQLGFITVSVGSAVLENITKHWLKKATEYINFVRVAGICFGRKKDTDIEIEQSFNFGYTRDEEIITDGNFYNTDLEFLGIYSNGSIPDDMDVCMLQALSQTLKRSLFLIKFNWSWELNDLSTTIFENVFDIHCNNFEARLLSMQAHSRPVYDSILNGQCSDGNTEKSKKKFYITFYDDYTINMYRFEVDINDDQKSMMDERRGIFTAKPRFMDYIYTLHKLAVDEGLKIKDVCPYRPIAHKDLEKKARKFLDKAKLELRFNFIIPLNLNGKHFVACTAEYLDGQNFAIGRTIKESQYDSLVNLLLNIITHDPKPFEEPSADELQEKEDFRRRMATEEGKQELIARLLAKPQSSNPMGSHSKDDQVPL